MNSIVQQSLEDQHVHCLFEIEGETLRVTLTRSQRSLYLIRSLVLLVLSAALWMLYSGVAGFWQPAMQGNPIMICFIVVWCLFGVLFTWPLMGIFLLPRQLHMQFHAQQGITTQHWGLRRLARRNKGLVLLMDIYPTKQQRQGQGKISGGFFARATLRDGKLKRFFPLALGSICFESHVEAVEQARTLKQFLRRRHLPIPVIICPHDHPQRGD